MSSKTAKKASKKSIKTMKASNKKMGPGSKTKHVSAKKATAKKPVTVTQAPPPTDFPKPIDDVAELEIAEIEQMIAGESEEHAISDGQQVETPSTPDYTVSQ
jgi:hypothetical protein